MIANLRARLPLLAAFSGIVSGTTFALASLFHAMAAAIVRGAQSLYIADIPAVPALAQLFLRLRAEAYSVGGVFFALCVLSIGLSIASQTSTPRRSVLTAMRTLATAFLILIAVSAFAADSPSIAAGRAALDRGDADQAIAQFEKAVAANPKDARAHYYLGLANGRKAQKAGPFGAMSLIGPAKEAWLRAIELDPNYIDARMRLIEFYTAAPGFAGGSEEKALEQAAEVKKRNALDGHRAYASIYTMQKKYDLAVKEMVEAVREQPKSAKAHYLLGNALLNQKNWKDSLHEYEMALSLDGAYMPAHFRIGQLAAQSESNYARGEEALRKYLAYKPAEDEPGTARAWYWLGMIQEKQGKKADARQSYANAQKLTPESKDINDALKRVS